MLSAQHTGRTQELDGAKQEKPLESVILPTTRACGKPDVEYSGQKC